MESVAYNTGWGYPFWCQRVKSNLELWKGFDVEVLVRSLKAYVNTMVRLARHRK